MMLRLASRLPLSVLYTLAGVVVWFLKTVMKYRTDVVYTNLAKSFPEKSYAELKEIADRFYEHLKEIIAEAVWFGGCDYERLSRQRICEITNMQDLVDTFNNSNSITILSSHCGNWEVLGGILSYNLEKVPSPITENMVYVVYRQLSNLVWNEVMRRNRTAPLPVKYDGVIESSRILRTALKNRDNKSIYIYPTDQYPYFSAHDIGMFMNQPTKAMMGSVGVAHKLGMSVMYMKMSPAGRGHYRMTFIPICMNAAEMEPEAIMRTYFDLLEKEIRETPYNWLWSHRRWK